MKQQQAPVDDPWVTVEELAAELRVPRGSVDSWRSRGVGPKSIKLGQHVRFRRSWINAWLIEKGDTTTALGQR